jgi:hypothetical protein
MGVPVEALVYDLIRQVNIARCNDDTGMALCVDLDKKLQSAATRVNENHTAMTAGIVESKRFIDERKKKCIEAITAGRNYLKGLIIDRDKQLRREAEERAAAERKEAEDKALADAERLAAEGKRAEADQVLAEGAELAGSVGPVQRVGPVRGMTAGAASIGKKWGFEIIDATAVPREFCTVDEKLIRKAAPKHPAQPPEIPGVKWIEEDTFANR